MAPPAPITALQGVTVTFGGRPLFDGIDLSIGRGDRACLVGRNGSGKSTLMKVLAGMIHPDGGTVFVQPGARLAYLPQEPDFTGCATVHDYVVQGLPADEQDEAHRVDAVLDRLQVDGNRDPRTLSGGESRRTALARTLVGNPDVMLLDEPTNHLDLEATIWLEGYLKNYPHTILLVSHDRELLNAVPTTTIHIDQGKLVTYSGNYDQFLAQRRANQERIASMAAKQEARRKHMMSYVDRFRFKASKARQAQSRLKLLEKMESITLMEDDPEVVFNFPPPDELAPPLIALEGVSIGYGDKVILRRVNLRIDMEDRIGLLGANGNGKSTLVKLLANRLQPMAGEMRRSSKLRIGYFAQHQAEELDLSLTPIQQTQRIMPLALEEKVRAHLGRFGFPQAKAETKIANLSGGEKARLLLALMSREVPHILMLDEPTNHLDIDSREALIEAINDFPGAVIIISHDPHLIEMTVDRLLLVADGTVQAYDGDLDDYRRYLLDRAKAERAVAKGGVERDAGPNKKDQRRAAAEARTALAPLKRKATDAEALVTKLSEEKRKIEAKMADPALYSGPSDKLTKLQIDLGTVEKKLATAEETWLEALELYESAAAEAGV